MSGPDLDEIIRTDPELRRLAYLAENGWRFEHKLGADGEIRQINGQRYADRYVDGLRVRDRTDVAGIRWDRADARVIWRREGRLAEVVDALLELPESS